MRIINKSPSICAIPSICETLKTNSYDYCYLLTEVLFSKKMEMAEFDISNPGKEGPKR